MIWLKVEEEVSSPIAKFLSEGELASIREAFSARAGDLILLLAGQGIERPLGELRLAIGREKKPIDDGFGFLWVTDFPLFELDEDGNLTASLRPVECLRPRAERDGAREREHQDPLQGSAGADLPPPPDRGGGGTGAVRLLPPRPRVRGPSPRRIRPRDGPAGDDDGERTLPPRRDRVPQDDDRLLPADRRADAGVGEEPIIASTSG